MSPTASLYNRGGTVGNDQAHSDTAGATTGADCIETEGGGRMDTDTDVNSSARTQRTETNAPTNQAEDEPVEDVSPPEVKEIGEGIIQVDDVVFERLPEDPTMEEVNADKDSFFNHSGSWYKKAVKVEE